MVLHRGRNVLDGDHVVEHQGAGDQHADRGRRARAGQERPVGVGQGDAAIEPGRDHEGVGRGHRRRLGGRGDAAVDAAQQDHRHHQRGKRLDGDARPFAQRDRLLDREIVPLGHDRVDDHLGQRHQQAGDHAAHEQVADRGVGHQGEQHHGDRGRDDRADDGRGRSDGRGIAARVFAVARHHVDHDAAGAGEVGDRRARHAGEDNALHDVDVAEPAAEAADQGVAEAQQAVGHAADVHQLGRQQEQRNGEQHPAVVEAVQQLLGGDRHVVPGQQHVEHRACDHRMADRQAEDRQARDRPQRQREGAGEVHGSGLTRVTGVSPLRLRHTSQT